MILETLSTRISEKVIIDVIEPDGRVRKRGIVFDLERDLSFSTFALEFMPSHAGNRPSTMRWYSPLPLNLGISLSSGLR